MSAIESNVNTETNENVDILYRLRTMMSIIRNTMQAVDEDINRHQYTLNRLRGNQRALERDMLLVNEWIEEEKKKPATNAGNGINEDLLRRYRQGDEL